MKTVTFKENYTLPYTDGCIDSLGDKKLFSALDTINGYWWMLISDGDRHKAAFLCHYTLYQFKHMLFGLTNAPAWFKRAMDIQIAK